MESMKSARKAESGDVGSDLSEQIKAATKDNHVRAENTELMLSYQKGQITLPQYKVRPPGAAVFPLPDLQGAGGGAGQERLAPGRRSHLLPAGARTPRVPGAGSGAFLRLGVEEAGRGSCCHPQIRAAAEGGGEAEPGAAGGPRLRSLPGRPVRRSGAGEDYPEVSGAERRRRGSVVLLLPRRDESQPLQAAVPQPHERHRADGGGEGGAAGGGRARLPVQHRGFRRLAENAERHGGSRRAVVARQSHVPAFTHHAVRRGAVRGGAHHHRDGTVRPVGSSVAWSTPHSPHFESGFPEAADDTRDVFIHFVDHLMSLMGNNGLKFQLLITSYIHFFFK